VSRSNADADERTLSTRDNAVGVNAYAARFRRFYDNEASASYDRSYKRDVFSHYRVRFYCEAAYFCAPFTAIVACISAELIGASGNATEKRGESSRDCRGRS